MSSILSVENVEIGMVLANPVVNRYGQVLISSGIELQQRHIKLLKTWGIKFIHLVGVDLEDECNAEIDETVHKQLESKLLQRMMWSPRNEPEKEMVQIAIKKHYRSLKSKEG